MGKNKSTKSDGVANFANTQDLGNQKRILQGVKGQGAQTSKKK
ncbi:MAG TPA: hypothetical protein VIK78_02535 [Ruminiclostridium sp.]